MLLTLLQLADSTLPIGAAAHSYGVETLAAEGGLSPESLRDFLVGHLEENLLLDAVFLHHAWRLGSTEFSSNPWRQLGYELSARRPAREARTASLALGRRFLALANAIEPRPAFEAALQAGEIHHSTAFGFACGMLCVPEPWAALGYLQQAVTGIVSACQRLMPLGQTAASQLIRGLETEITSVAERSGVMSTTECSAFSPAIEVAAMRHPLLETRLFIS